MAFDGGVRGEEMVDAPSTGRGAVALVARRTWQSGWRQHVLLAAMVSLTVAVVLAVLLGAERSATAMDRLRDETRASDVLLGDGDSDVTRPPRVRGHDAWCRRGGCGA